MRCPMPSLLTRDPFSLAALPLADNSKEHIEGMTDRLRNHNAKRKFRKAGYAAMAIARLGVFSAIKLTCA